ncbi:hypothetical protein [Pseudohoeflea coraliihabitans]|uniref:HTH cro/C1-type domain-containing protein n=1 Tax=Pseudohoeflea coraliihabitans TaxID=2860393 RepID=A0ABS6WLM1_9HYPH|nr:hypothetical protein [Pseudohoeflea sp. DP4N28-3]MBW3096838.1 hypothetical protein [Pseudohoeflea sp. DP4N28-3]
MKCSETRHSEFRKEPGKTTMTVTAFSPAMAAEYAAKMFRMKVRGWGDEARTISDLARRCGMSEVAYKRLMRGKTKEPGITVFGRVRAAYYDLCESEIRRLSHEIEIDRERFGDAAVEDLAGELEALRERIRKARAGA